MASNVPLRDDEEAVPQSVGSGVPLEPSRPFARMTSFSLKPNESNTGFAETAEEVDTLFSEEILPRAPSQKGFIACQRLIGSVTGECIIYSFWETQEDCKASQENEYYRAPLVKIRDYARYGMIKTESFEVMTLKPEGGSGMAPMSTWAHVIASPFVRLTTMTMDVGKGSQESFNSFTAPVDEYFQDNILPRAREKNGFCGAQRLLGIDDTIGTYVFITYWDSHGTLLASAAAASAEANEALELLAPVEQNESFVTGIQPFAKDGTSITTRVFEHLQFERSRVSTPFFEAGSTSAAVFQFSCISLGVGIFQMPSVFATVGPLMGSLLLVVFAVLSDFCIQLVLEIAANTGVNTFEDALGAAFGKFGRMAALSSLALSLGTANCAHMSFSAGMFVKLQGKGGGYMQTLVGPDVALQTFCTMLQFGLVALPFCFKRNLNDLRHMSLVVVVYCLFASACVVQRSLSIVIEKSVHYENELIKPVSIGVMLDIAPVAAFGFSIMGEVFSVRAEAKDPAKLGKCIHVATLLVGLVYLFVGLAGALAIEKPGGNILLSFLDINGTDFFNVIMFGLVIVITLLYPLINFPAAAALDALFAGEHGSANLRRRQIGSVFLLIAVLVIDTVMGKNLGLLFGLAGSLGLGLLAYVLPVSAYLALAHAGKLDAKITTAPYIILAVVTLIIGLIMTIGGTGHILYTAIYGHASSAPPNDDAAITLVANNCTSVVYDLIDKTAGSFNLTAEHCHTMKVI